MAAVPVYLLLQPMTTKKQNIPSDYTSSTVHISIGRTHTVSIAAFERYTGINLVKWRVLYMLYTHGECSQKALVELTDLDAWSITRAVKPLEQDGMVERRIEPSDNRMTLVRLTPQGVDFYQRLEQGRDDFLKHALHGLSAKQLETLESLLSKIESNLRAPPVFESNSNA